ncbi:MAG: hypothetical protein AAGC67_22155, partial [Myxococcota bacterium]
LPAWVAAEAFVIRGFWIDDLGGVPWATLSAAIAFGAASAGALRLLDVEARVDAMASSRRKSGPNPVVLRAARMRSDGDPYQAFDLIQAAWREDPGDPDVSEAFFSIAVEVDQPEAASEAILPQLRAALRKGEFTRAIDYWYPLAAKRCDVRLEPTAFVRLGEALLDASHPEEALFSLRGAIDAGVSSAGAARIVNIARDLDADLTRTSAELALADETIEGQLREELERLVAASAPPAPAHPAPPPESRSQLDRRVQAEHQTLETTAFPLELDSDVETAASPEANEEALAAQALDPGALSAETLADDATPAPEAAPVDSGDVLSHWNDQSALDADTLSDLSGDLGSTVGEEDLFEVDDLETPESGFDFGLGDADAVDPRDDETDTDLTPLMDATDELTSPIAADPADEDTSTAVFGEAETPAGSEAEAQTAFLAVPEFDGDAARTTLFDAAPAVAAPADDDAEAHTAFLDAEYDDAQTAFLDVQDDEARTVLFEGAPRGSAPNADIAFASPASETTVLSLRAIKAVDAVPVGASDDWIEIDAAGRGKSKLPLARIEAIAIGAVGGLGPRPVLVLDFVLNWTGEADQPIKSIRIRSDQFDPLAFAPGAANPLDALTDWIASLEAQTGATCLPTREVLAGRFGRFADLATYERDVLMAESAA